jgi:hypothetical protein
MLKKHNRRWPNKSQAMLSQAFRTNFTQSTAETWMGANQWKDNEQPMMMTKLSLCKPEASDRRPANA